MKQLEEKGLDVKKTYRRKIRKRTTKITKCFKTHKIKIDEEKESRGSWSQRKEMYKNGWKILRRVDKKRGEVRDEKGSEERGRKHNDVAIETKTAKKQTSVDDGKLTKGKMRDKERAIK